MAFLGQETYEIYHAKNTDQRHAVSIPKKRCNVVGFEPEQVRLKVPSHVTAGITTCLPGYGSVSWMFIAPSNRKGWESLQKS
jgi:hypothetical protein